MRFILESIAFTLDDCRIAQAAGADRIELCDNAGEGGTTPSAGFIHQARQQLSIDLYVMIRPRGGDFLYTDEDYAMLKRDIKICKDAGCDGVVFGALLPRGTINKQQCAILVEQAYPMGVTFHRAFDRAAEPFKALEDIIDIGCERILTSGQKPTAEEGAALISELIKTADDRIIIMPGAGVRANNLSLLRDKTGACEFHSAPRIMQKSKMQFINDEMNEANEALAIDGESIRQMRSILNSLQA